MMNSRILGRLGLGLFLPLAAVSCASIIGVSEGEVVAEDGGGDASSTIRDEATNLETTEDCIDYCDLLEENCTGEFSQYAARIACIQTCNILPEGTASEPIGNTLSCRLKFASAADMSPTEFCATAGPAGLGECGNKCAAYCTLLASACETDFSSLDNCEASCEVLAEEGGGFDSSRTTGDTVDCRIYHSSAALDEPETHCGHAAFLATDLCVEGSDTPTCTTYCRNVMAACRGDNAIYASDEECLDTCPDFEVGSLEDQAGDTLGCRQYHAGAALTGPTDHCPHASPDGGGMCE